jgi:hypothetical protein
MQIYLLMTIISQSLIALGRLSRLGDYWVGGPRYKLYKPVITDYISNSNQSQASLSILQHYKTNSEQNVLYNVNSELATNKQPLEC